MNQIKPILLASACFASLAHAEVLTTIKPLGFIANAITDGVTQTKVLLPNNASVHDYSLRLSDVNQVKKAELVVWVGEGLDGFLAKSVAHREAKNVLTLSDYLMPYQHLFLTGEHHHHDHDEEAHHDDEHHHSHGEKAHHNDAEHHHDDEELEHVEQINWHIWLSPEISEKIAEGIAEKLSHLYPQDHNKIQQNLHKFKQNLHQTTQSIQAQLAEVQNKGFYVFHDAYGYFNQTFGLNQRGYFTFNPMIATGAKALAEIKADLQAQNAQCLFAEPQFTPKVIQNLAQQTKVKVGTLDPMGSQIALSPNAYAEFLQQMATSYRSCLMK